MKKIFLNRKLILSVIFVLFFMVLSGCFEISQEFTHNVDGTGRFFIKIGITKEMPGATESPAGPTGPFNDWVKADGPLKKDPNILDIQAKDFQDEKNFYYTVDIKFKDFEKGIQALQKVDKKPDFKLEKLANNNYKYTQVFKPSSTLPIQSSLPQGNTAFFQGQENPFKDRFYEIKLTVPHPVNTDPSAVVDKKTGEILWKLPMEQMMMIKEEKEIWAEYSLKAE